MLTTFNEIDMSNLMTLRSTYKDAFLEKHGVKLGFMSCFVKASAKALQAVPAVNAIIDGDEIVYKQFYDVSIAVSAPKGLVVPVLRCGAFPITTLRLCDCPYSDRSLLPCFTTTQD